MALSKLAIGLIAGIGSVAAVGATTAAVVVTRNNNQNTTSVESNTEVSINDKGEVNANSNTSANVDPDKELERVFDVGSQESKKAEEKLKENLKTEAEATIKNESTPSTNAQLSDLDRDKKTDVIADKTEKGDGNGVDEQKDGEDHAMLSSQPISAVTPSSQKASSTAKQPDVEAKPDDKKDEEEQENQTPLDPSTMDASGSLDDAEQ